VEENPLSRVTTALEVGEGVAAEEVGEEVRVKTPLEREARAVLSREKEEKEEDESMFSPFR